MDKLLYHKIKDKTKFPNKIFRNAIPKKIRQHIVTHFEKKIFGLASDANKSIASRQVSFILPCPEMFCDLVKGFVLPSLTNFPLQKFKLQFSSPCVLYLVEPTMPHVDGHYVYKKELGYLYKTILIPLCIIKKNDVYFSFDNVIFTLFHQHLNYAATLGGLEFNKTFIIKSQIQKYKHTKFYEKYIGKDYFNKAGIEDLPIEDSNGNPLTINLKKSWIHKQNIIYFHKMVKEYKSFREIASQIMPNLDSVLFNCLQGLTIENIYKFKDGDFLVQNPYQTHCSGDFNGFDSKLCLRLNIYIDYK